MLFELKPTVATDEPAMRQRFGGSSQASLHAKTFAVDDRRIFVGSFNFDPRSARLNTEMGVVIESPALAARLVERLDKDLPAIAWEVRLRDDASLEWVDRASGGEERHATEPGTTALRRAWIRMLEAMPIEDFRHGLDLLRRREAIKVSFTLGN